MSQISRSVLFSKLNEVCYKSLENAYTYSKFRENSYVELVHWIHVLLQNEENDIAHIIKHFDINLEVLRQDVLSAIEKLPHGASNVIDFSVHIETIVEGAWTYASLKYNDTQIRSYVLLYIALMNKQLSNILLNISYEFSKIKTGVLEDDFDTITKNSSEKTQTKPTSDNLPKSETDSPLAKYGINLTQKAKEGKIDNIIGRDDEIRHMIDILMRRRQNNPILIGEAGVGKTAVVEALALKLASGDVPDVLSDVSLYVLDIGLLKAGASMTGEFEARLRSVIDEVEASLNPIVLFIDEIHTLIGAGGSAGTGDAANLLKPALARGTLKTIGATTWSEYKKYFEKDPALTRRFQVIQVDEPNEDKAVEMLRSLMDTLESHHGIIVLDDAVRASVKLSQRYIPQRQLPDKAVSLIDTACARVALSQHAKPSQLEFLERKLENLALEKSTLLRENTLSYDVTQRLEEIEQLSTNYQKKLDDINQQWQTEKELVAQLIDLRKQIFDNKKASEQETSELLDKELSSKQQVLMQELANHQGDNPLVFPLVDASTVAKVVSDWTGIPVGKMVKNELQSILDLSEILNQRIIDQEQGIEEIVKRIQTSRAGLDDPNKPIGVFMLVGPSGVGKTETALALADVLYGGEHNVITINMSEYQEAHSVSTLKGAPPGYVGYGEGGVLTEAVRRKPYSVVLLDEIEKAHPDIHEIFFQVFDKGWMEDGEGRYIDFKNTIILLTSNIGTELIMDMDKDGIRADAENIKTALKEPLLDVFPAALLGRIQIVPYHSLSKETLKKILGLHLNKITNRVYDNHKIKLTYTEQMMDLVINRCNDTHSGGRMIDSILTNSLLPKLSQSILTHIIEGRQIASINVDAIGEDFEFRIDYGVDN
ncbi:type VI secretion system protein VasG [Moraxella cuniculi DSM 21768]|uniref:Type VI secretion system protein VasG n=1 Tax=Moraxella cuniculi DSM 21768 TaxID=1122245 RepID=A0A1N7FS71_9GAMM|nr:type VI secretion system ATPase TssH [Moraxella cuniculi]OOS08353.1 ClpV1 family T6SS ATPase [Moraxella cuniculi]SIS03116.1 type VI secretion system protein VasG [Moraxella cuniculi DSM 21768]